MKKQLLLLATLVCASASHAQYTGPSTTPTNVRTLLAEGKDDMPVVLQGKIARHSGSDKYRFVDSSGEITLEIDSKRWPANTPINENTEVRVFGEFDKSLMGEAEVDVERIEKVM